MSILSILEPACRPPSSPRHPVLADGNIPATTGADLLVPLADGRVTDYANFDHGASAPCLDAVDEPSTPPLPSYASVHRGNGYASRITTQWYERARAEVHGFVGARPDDQVVFTRQTTDALNLLARCLPDGTTVVVFESEHHAALLPWERGPAGNGEAAAAGVGDRGRHRRRGRPAGRAGGAAAGLRDRRVERHRRAAAGGRDREGGPRARCPGLPRRGPAGAAPAGRHRRPRGRLGGTVRAQAVRAVRCGRTGRPGRLAGGSGAVPRRWWCDRGGQPGAHGLGRRRGPARGRLAERHRRDRTGRRLRDDQPAPGRDRAARAESARPAPVRADRDRRA